MSQIPIRNHIEQYDSANQVNCIDNHIVKEKLQHRKKKTFQNAT